YWLVRDDERAQRARPNRAPSGPAPVRQDVARCPTLDDLPSPLRGRSEQTGVPGRARAHRIRSNTHRHGVLPTRVRAGVRVDGIRYGSATKDGGVCVVLFVDNELCADNPENVTGTLLLTRA